MKGVLLELMGNQYAFQDVGNRRLNHIDYEAQASVVIYFTMRENSIPYIWIYRPNYSKM